MATTAQAAVVEDILQTLELLAEMVEMEYQAAALVIIQEQQELALAAMAVMVVVLAVRAERVARLPQALARAALLGLVPSLTLH